MANAETIVTARWPHAKDYPDADELFPDVGARAEVEASSMSLGLKHVLFMLLKNAIYWGSCILMITLIVLALRTFLF